MNIQHQPTYTPQFEARIRLNEARKFYNPSNSSKTSLDAMFNENRAVKGLEAFSLFIKKRVINEHFKNPTNPVSKFALKMLDKSIKYSRILADKIFFLSNRSAIKDLNKTFTKINPASKEYIDELAKVGNSISDKFVVTNIENTTIDRLAKSKDATIFVLNHPNYHKDKFVYMILNSMLNKSYVEHGRQMTCPRPKIIVSKNMLKMLGEKVGNIYKKLGLTEVDASLKGRDSSKNIEPMKQLLKEFVENKSNIFIFPEGNNSTFASKTMEEKIQPGIAKFVKSALKAKGNVRIVPVGIDYPKDKNSFGNIFIGKPILLRESGREFVYTQGTDKKHILRGKPQEVVKTVLKEICDNLNFGIKQAKELT